MIWGYVYKCRFVKQEVALKVATVNEEFLLNAKRARQLSDGTIEEMPNLKVSKKRERPIQIDFKNAGEIALEIARREKEELQRKLGA